jgi:hypothetical protein
LAPRLQPVITETATVTVQSCQMAVSPEDQVTKSDMCDGESLPDLKAGREVGWIFKYGEAVAIERHECEFRVIEDAS